jgi:membrane-bound lytic murein transglycosylase B
VPRILHALHAAAARGLAKGAFASRRPRLPLLLGLVLGLPFPLLVGLGGCASPAVHDATPAPVASAPEPVAPAQAGLTAGVPAPPSAADLEARDKGWGWMVDRLADGGIPREEAARAFADDRMPDFEGLLFGLNPSEPRSLYRHFLRPRSVARARACAAENARWLDAAERVHGVDASVVAAILYVETGCGAYTGRSLVLHRLARLAMANEPHNLARNLSRWTGSDGWIDPETAERVRARARYLDAVFYPQVVATFQIAERNEMDPLDLRGSSAGAIGFPQFLPLNYIAFGTDGDGDGRVSLFDPADAAASCARFLASHGWRGDLDRADQRRVIAAYNPSAPYVDTVLRLAYRIRRSGVLEAATAAAASGLAVPVGAPGAAAEPVTWHP